MSMSSSKANVTKFHSPQRVTFGGAAATGVENGVASSYDSESVDRLRQRKASRRGRIDEEKSDSSGAASVATRLNDDGTHKRIDYSKWDSLEVDTSDSEAEDEEEEEKQQEFPEPKQVDESPSKSTSTPSTSTSTPSISLSRSHREMTKNGADMGHYLWGQTQEEVWIRVKLPDDAKPSEMDVDVESPRLISEKQNLVIKRKGSVIVSGMLKHHVWGQVEVNQSENDDQSSSSSSGNSNPFFGMQREVSKEDQVGFAPDWELESQHISEQLTEGNAETSQGKGEGKGKEKEKEKENENQSKQRFIFLHMRKLVPVPGVKVWWDRFFEKDPNPTADLSNIQNSNQNSNANSNAQKWKEAWDEAHETFRKNIKAQQQQQQHQQHQQ